jgi:hypothetical protein
MPLFHHPFLFWALSENQRAASFASELKCSQTCNMHKTMVVKARRGQSQCWLRSGGVHTCVKKQTPSRDGAESHVRCGERQKQKFALAYSENAMKKTVTGDMTI